MADDTLTKIDEQVKNNKVMLYMKGNPQFPQCGFSAHTVEILQSYGFPFETADVLADQQLREGIKRYSNWPTIPQIFINGKFVGGCDIVHEMHERGELEPAIKAAFEK
ncbi:MAG: Grx4 family monothiol glutaredoxin [Candidatus Binatia bacterium]